MPPPGADGSPGAVAKRTQLYADRLRDLSPVFRQLSVEFAQQTDAAFRNSRSPFGEDFPRLAPSTVARRAAKLRGAKARSKKTGKLTKGARAKRSDARARYAAGGPGIFTPLIDSGRMRQSVRYVPRRDGIDLSGVGYLRFHVSGSLKVKNRPPKRNPLVVQFTSSGSGLALIPSANSRMLRAITAFVETGSVPAR